MSGMSPGSQKQSFALRVNGRRMSATADPATPLLYILRNDFGFNGPKFGCGLGECGACTVLIDGRAARSCVVALGRVGDRSILTLEGLGDALELGVVQAAFVQEQAAQCGYCINGMVMTTHAAIQANPDIDEHGMRLALRHNLCRCGTHVEIMRAAMRAADAVRKSKDQS